MDGAMVFLIAFRVIGGVAEKYGVFPCYRDKRILI
jgi:hypothetical protein